MNAPIATIDIDSRNNNAIVNADTEAGGCDVSASEAASKSHEAHMRDATEDVELPEVDGIAPPSASVVSTAGLSIGAVVPPNAAPLRVIQLGPLSVTAAATLLQDKASLFDFAVDGSSGGASVIVAMMTEEGPESS